MLRRFCLATDVPKAFIPPPPPYPTPRLLDDMMRLNEELRAPREQFKELDTVLTQLDKEVKGRLPITRIAPFGSCSNGLWTKASDVDLTMIIPRCNNKIKIINKLKTVRSLLSHTMATCMPLEFSVVENARIPVLKITNKSDSLIREIDISVNNLSGIENSLLVKNWCVMDERFVPLARCIKHWAKKRGINDRAKGTLSTYTILLQVVFLLQTRNVIPKFSSYAKSHVLEKNDEFFELNGVERELPFHVSGAMQHPLASDRVHELFAQFFNLFGDDAMQEGVEIVDGEIVSRGNGVLIMRCPLTGKDVNVMNSSAWNLIHAEYKRARDLINHGATLDELVSN
jgi:DNA polymerase sigma